MSVHDLEQSSEKPAFIAKDLAILASVKRWHRGEPATRVQIDAAMAMFIGLHARVSAQLGNASNVEEASRAAAHRNGIEKLMAWLESISQSRDKTGTG